MAELPRAEREIDLFLAAFEGCTLPKEQWTHSAHLFTGACYVHAMGEDAAASAMRGNVSRYNVSVGGQNTATSGYHETVTVAWIKLLAEFRRRRLGLERAAFAAEAVAYFAPQREIFRRHYDFDLVASSEARMRWIEPNLEPIG